MRPATRAAIAAAEEACLRALLGEHATKSPLAIRTGIPASRVMQALESLQQRGSVERSSALGAWRLTNQGRRAAAALSAPTMPTDAERQRRRGGRSGDRLWALLDRPMSAREISEVLGVTRQNVMHLIVRLAVEGRIRFADPENLGLMVARAEDTSILLTEAQARVLSTLPEPGAPKVPVASIARAISMRACAIAGHFDTLSALQLVVRQRRGGNDVFGLTEAGAGHAQRNSDARRAVAPEPRLPVRSDRIRCVLAHLDLTGPTRTSEIAKALNLPPQSMNALMQYLKRQGLASKAGADQLSPHGITQEGRSVLAKLEQTRSST